MTNKLVSVIIPTYKRPDTLDRAINSVLNQTYKNIEIIVVDDNEPDSELRVQTENIVAQYLSKNQIIYVKHPYNKNGSAARNTGFKHSKGEYIAFLDDDDEFLPNKIEVQYNKLENLDHSWGACYTNYNQKKDSKIISRYADNKEGSLLIYALSRNLLTASGSNLFVRRKVYDELNGFDESFTRNQDYEFLVRLLKKYKYAYCPQLTLTIYAHKTNHQYINISNKFLDSFKNDIDSLSNSDKKIVYKNLYLQLFTYYLLKERNLKKSLSVIYRKISLIELLKYILYLSERFVFKTKKSFEI